jgi:subtilisin family serine protease
MPRLRHGETRESAGNIQVLEEIGRLLAGHRDRRAQFYADRAKAIQRLGGTVLNFSALSDVIEISIAPDRLDTLAANLDAIAIGPATFRPRTLTTFISTGRAMMNSDPYFNLGLNGGYIGLLDTGVRQTHVLLAGNFSWVRDCLNGKSGNCAVAGPGLTLDPSDGTGHGTVMANVLGGSLVNSFGFGDAYRGVTDILIDSFKVVAPDDVPWQSGYQEVERGFLAAIAGGDDVISCSFSCGDLACNAFANAAFDSGAVVVAAAGNASNPSTIGDIADGAKVLAVGATDTAQTRASFSSQGPSSSGRTKPDIMALGVSVRTAKYTGDSAWTTSSGTSVAAPFVAGAAGLMRRWLGVSFGGAIEPGQVLAMLIAAGNNNGPDPAWNNAIGAGNLVMPTSASLTGWKTSVTNQVNKDRTITIAAGKTTLDAAIWWPESSVHNDVDLFLLDSTGATVTWSDYSAGVWEKVHANVQPGTYTLRVTGYSVSGTQSVYLAGIAR